MRIIYSKIQPHLGTRVKKGRTKFYSDRNNTPNPPGSEAHSALNRGDSAIPVTHHAVFDRRAGLQRAFYPGPDGRLQAFFPRNGMLPCTERIFFRGPVFPVPVSYFLPDTLREQLPGLQQTVIAAGLYPIRRNSAGFVIEF